MEVYNYNSSAEIHTLLSAIRKKEKRNSYGFVN